MRPNARALRSARHARSVRPGTREQRVRRVGRDPPGGQRPSGAAPYPQCGLAAREGQNTGVLWSGCRDSNPGPSVPQNRRARIAHLPRCPKMTSDLRKQRSAVFAVCRRFSTSRGLAAAWRARDGVVPLTAQALGHQSEHRLRLRGWLRDLARNADGERGWSGNGVRALVQVRVVLAGRQGRRVTVRAGTVGTSGPATEVARYDRHCVARLPDGDGEDPETRRPGDGGWTAFVAQCHREERAAARHLQGAAGVVLNDDIRQYRRSGSDGLRWQDDAC